MYGANVKYYNVKKDCSLDQEDLISKIDGKTCAIVVIHYFGFSQSLQFVKDFSRKQNLFLIEDCAHVLPVADEGPPLGRSGDISIFSMWKYFPMPDGGALVVNNTGLHVHVQYRKGVSVFMKGTKNALDRLVHDSKSEKMKMVYNWLALSTKAVWGIIAGCDRDDVAVSLDPFSEDLYLEDVNQGMSTWSKRIFKNADVKSIIEKRRSHYEFYLRSFQGIDQLRIFFPDLGGGICPLVFSFAVDGAEEFHLKLRMKGIPATTWGGVVHPSCPMNSFPDADHLYRNLVMLPVHQSLAEDDLRYICETTIELIRCI
jgi:dTDP-4-amino-4,6-dideoxygalactose transaminase